MCERVRSEERRVGKECPNYLRGKGKVLTTTLSDLESSNSDAEGEYCKVEFYQQSCWLYSVPNLLVF